MPVCVLLLRAAIISIATYPPLAVKGKTYLFLAVKGKTYLPLAVKGKTSCVYAYAFTCMCYSGAACTSTEQAVDGQVGAVSGCGAGK